jgi:small subunit ribosomal protein S5
MQQRNTRNTQGGDRGGRDDGLAEVTVHINRNCKVVKGGKRFSFSALVVVGDRAGRAGVGFAKANDVPSAVDKANKEARKNMFTIPMVGTTIPHKVRGRFGAGHIVILPAPPGTGVIAGAVARAVLTTAGVGDVLTKSFGSGNPVNLIKATLDALHQLRTREQVEALRGVTLPS